MYIFKNGMRSIARLKRRNIMKIVNLRQRTGKKISAKRPHIFLPSFNVT